MNQKFLVVRPDNIGDLVLTTPLIAALRKKYPDAWIGALVNAYNAPVLNGNPRLDAVYAYQKLKHVSGVAKLGAAVQYAKLIAALRAQRIDIALIPSRGSQARSARLAKIAGAKRIVGFADADSLPDRAKAIEHEAEDVFALARVFGIEGAPGPCEVFPQKASIERARQLILGGESQLRIAIHISARKPSQRWPIERYAALMRTLHERYAAAFVLFWAPGTADDKTHPGDDSTARELIALTHTLPVTAFPTHDLDSLIAGLSLCDLMICSDGGAMHLGAALGKPIVCFFGQSDTKRWRPWGVPFELLQAPSSNAADISVIEAVRAAESIVGKAGLDRSSA